MSVNSRRFLNGAFRIQKMLALAVLLVCCLQSYAQVAGPKCVIQGLIYQYNINIQQQNGIEVCITGGKIHGYENSCRKQAAVSDIHIVWDSAAISGKIVLKSGDVVVSTYNVQITGRLNGGKIDSLTLLQSVKANELPSDIKCSEANNGNCNVSFKYQWQQSADYLKWEPVPGATAKNLSHVTKPKGTTFFRRMVIEISSGAQAYSDIATVVVLPLPPGTN